MTATGLYTCTRCGPDAKPLRAAVDDVLALLGLCAAHQAERLRVGLEAKRKAEGNG